MAASFKCHGHADVSEGCASSLVKLKNLMEIIYTSLVVMFRIRA